MKLVPQQLEAIVGLMGNRDFTVLMQAIASTCQIDNERLIKNPEANEYLRGQVFALTDLLESINNASTKFQQAKQPKT